MSRDRDLLPPAAYARMFENLPEGVQILEELTQIFVRPAKRTGGIDAVLETYHREGARSVIEWIVGRINAAHGVDPNLGDEDDH